MDQTADDEAEEVEKTKKLDEQRIQASSKHINKEMLKHVNRFYRKQKKGTIDVWWLFDDGGEKASYIHVDYHGGTYMEK